MKNRRNEVGVGMKEENSGIEEHVRDEVEK